MVLHCRTLSQRELNARAVCKDYAPAELILVQILTLNPNPLCFLSFGLRCIMSALCSAAATVKRQVKMRSYLLLYIYTHICLLVRLVSYGCLFPLLLVCSPVSVASLSRADAHLLGSPGLRGSSAVE